MGCSSSVSALIQKLFALLNVAFSERFRVKFLRCLEATLIGILSTLVKDLTFSSDQTRMNIVLIRDNDRLARAVLLMLERLGTYVTNSDHFYRFSKRNSTRILLKGSNWARIQADWSDVRHISSYSVHFSFLSLSLSF